MKVTGLSDAWCGLLAVEFVFDADIKNISYGMEDVPVSIPMNKVDTGLLVSTWFHNAPWWINADKAGRTDGVLIESDDGHGFRVFYGSDKAFSVKSVSDERLHFQARLLVPKAGESKTFRFRMAPDLSNTAMRSAAREQRGQSVVPAIHLEKASALRASGFIKRDRWNTGFVDETGTPYYAIGLNTHSGQFLIMPPVEQERVLQAMEKAGMTVMRIITFDWIFHPVPGVWNMAAMKQLKETIDRCAAHGIRVLLCLEYSAAAYQYSIGLHLSPSDQDIYFMKEMLRDYKERVDFIVKPLKDDPAVMAWTVSNEPGHMLKPDKNSRATTSGFKEWLKNRYGTIGQVAAAWKRPVLTNFNQITQPEKEGYEKQLTRADRDFFDFQNDVIAETLIDRGRLIKHADDNHLVGISDGFSRRMAGHAGAELFDFQAPHTYDLWSNGREILRHVFFLLAQHRDALPGNPRPVIVEEFGISEQPQFSPAMRAEHIRQFMEAGKRWGMAGIIQWWDMNAEAYAAFAAEKPYVDQSQSDGPTLAVYLPPSQEWNLVFYGCIGVRRRWENAVFAAVDAGFSIKVISSPEQAGEATAILVLADSLNPVERLHVRRSKHPVYLLPEAAALKTTIPVANVLPASWEAQKNQWRKQHE